MSQKSVQTHLNKEQQCQRYLPFCAGGGGAGSGRAGLVTLDISCELTLFSTLRPIDDDDCRRALFMQPMLADSAGGEPRPLYSLLFSRAV